MNIKSLLTFMAAILLMIPASAQSLWDLDTKAVAGQPTSKRALPSATQRPQQRAAKADDNHGIITTPPAGQRQYYERSGIAYYPSDDQIYTVDQGGAVEIVDCGDGTVYIKDIISNYLIGTWVKGTKDGNTITVAPRQPVAYSEKYDATISVRWGRIDTEGNFLAADDHADNFTFIIEGDKISLQDTTPDEDGAESYFMGIVWDDDNTVPGYGDVQTVWTKIDVVEQVDQLPYSNPFETVAEQTAFSIHDSNGDGSTWNWIYNTDGEHYARYSYNYDNNGDDWLISPAIRLEAGKLYRVAFDTRSADSEERIEMKMGLEPTAEAMTIEVIAPTAVSWSENQTLANDHLTVGETGYYHFGIHAISERDKYRLYADNFLVDVEELEAPAAVADLQVVATPDQLEATITFTAPATKRDGTPLDGNLTKVELLRDGSVIHTFDNVAPGAALSYVDNDETLTIGYHTYQVVATNDKGIGQMSAEVKVRLDAILEVPYKPDLTQESAIDAFTVIDHNDDGSTWQWEDGYGTTYVYNAENEGDDYLITPRIRLKGGKNYYMVVNAVTTGYDERFEVLLGKEPTAEALTTQVMAPTLVTNSEDPGDIFEQVFSVPDDGVYYIALHAISDADMDHLTVNFIAIEDGPDPKAPAAPLFEVTPNPAGELTVAVKVTVPTHTFDGTPLGSTLQGGFDIYCDGEVVDAVKGSLQTGTTLPDINIEVATHDFHVFQVIPYIDEIGYGMKSAKDTVYVGVDIPTAAENFTAIDHLDHLTLKWDKVGDTGANGNYVNTEKVNYNIWTTKWEDGFFGPELVYDQQLAQLTDNDTYDVAQSTNEGDQHWEYWVLEPETAAGVGENTVTGLVVGAPYELPLTEGFAGNALHYFWDSDAELLVSEMTSDGDDTALALTSQYPGECYFLSGKVDISKAAYPVLLFDVRAQGVSEITVTGSVDGPMNERTLQSGIPVTEDYTTVCIPLASLKGGHYAQVGINVGFTNPSSFDWMTGELQSLGDVMLLDNVRIVDDQQLAINGVQGTSQQLLDVYSLDGRLVRHQAKNLTGLKGAFVVRQQGKGKTIVVK